MMNPVDFNDQLFKNTKRRLERLEARLQTLTGRSARAEIAGSTPRWEAVTDLPAAGILGRLASVEDDIGGGAGDAGLFWDDGANWVQIV